MADTIERPPSASGFISLFEEALAYETIWAIVDKMSPKDVESSFDTNGRSLPTAALKELMSQELFDVDNLKEKVEHHMRQNSGVANICVNGDGLYPMSTIADAQYPPRLFYYRGEIALLYTASVSIVGARKASEEGRQIAHSLASDLASQGYVIVSGLARGIDHSAHSGAIESGGRTIAVIGTPINQYYPPENEALQKEIARDHLLISHVPFYFHSRRDWRTNRLFFPLRNSTMAAVSRATVIVEASDTSGSLTQARECLRQNRILFIHENCVNNPSLKWPEKFVRKGAHVFRKSSEILGKLPDPSRYDD